MLIVIVYRKVPSPGKSLGPNFSVESPTPLTKVKTGPEERPRTGCQLLSSGHSLLLCLFQSPPQNSPLCPVIAPHPPTQAVFQETPWSTGCNAENVTFFRINILCRPSPCLPIDC